MNILVTRPEPAATQLANHLVQQGHSTTVFPLFEITLLPNGDAVQALRALKGDEVLIFVSKFAVDALHAGQISIPATCAVYAVGKGTAAVLKRAYPHLSVTCPSGPADSEHLLAELSSEPLEGRPVLICRGDYGREWLFDALLAKGAQVAYVTCYQRKTQQSGFEEVLDAWQRHAFDVVVVTSTEALTFLLTLMQGHMTVLRQSRVTVMGDRMKQLAALHELNTIPAEDYIKV